MSQQVTVVLGGDMHVQRAEPESMFAHVGDYLRAADLTFGNLEVVPTGVRNPAAGRKDSRIISDERMMAAYTAAGFDAVGLANNHSMDQGLEGLLRCIELLDEAGIARAGGGKNGQEARTPAILERHGTKVAFLSYTSVFPPGWAANDRSGGLATVRARTSFEPHPLVIESPGAPPITHTSADPAELERLRWDVRAAKEQADVVVVSWHWGLSPLTGGAGWSPVLEYQIECGHAAVDAGADLVMGHHPHMLQGIEVYETKPIFYSVGNFAFDFLAASGKFKDDPRHQKATLVRIAIKNKAVEHVWAVPLRMGIEGQPLLQDGKEGADIIELMRKLSQPFGTVLEASGEGVLVAGKDTATV